MSQWFRNGKRIESLAIDDRAVQYGDGLFETIAIRQGKARLFDLHMRRLARGCERLGIAMPDEVTLQQDLADAIEKSRELAAYCVAKIIVSSGTGQRGYGRSMPVSPVVLIGVFPARPVAASAYRNGVDTILCESRLATGSPTAGLKTLNRIEQVLGRSECLAAGTFEGLMLDAGERLICGTMSNVFIVAGQRVMTPELRRCGVEGVMRQLAIDSLRSDGVRVEERDISIDDCKGAEELFLTNSQFGALPVSQLGDVAWKTGEMTRRLLRLLARNGIAECAV